VGDSDPQEHVRNHAHVADARAASTSATPPCSTTAAPTTPEYCTTSSATALYSNYLSNIINDVFNEVRLTKAKTEKNI
jgi:hypothetical protein